jgi:putative N6-adenine-specific DNA methylase
VNSEETLTVRGLQRRIKRYITGMTQDFLAITTPGFESVLSSEIAQCGNAEIKQTITGGVEFSAHHEFLYYANLNVRSANRILLRIATFTVRSYPELYNKMKRIQWELYCGFSGTFSLSVSSKNSRLHHTENIQNSVSEAIIAYMQSLGVTTQYADNAPIQFFIRFADDECTVSIDTSGELLYKRGYRINTAHAPIRETIAASLLIESEWKKCKWIIDPFCGSGTILIEAAQLALNMPPGGKRPFAFQSWPSFNEIQMRRTLLKVEKELLTDTAITFAGSDISDQALKAATENTERAGVSKFIKYSLSDCFDVTNQFGDNDRGLIISNLPYGKRADVKDTSMDTFIRRLSLHLKKKFLGAHFTFVSAYPEFEKVIGFRLEKVIAFSNGGIPVKAYFGIVK